MAKGGHTRVTQTLIEKAIEEFITLTNGNFPSLTIDDRNALILAIRKLDLARAAWKLATKNKIKHTLLHYLLKASHTCSLRPRTLVAMSP